MKYLHFITESIIAVLLFVKGVKGFGIKNFNKNNSNSKPSLNQQQATAAATQRYYKQGPQDSSVILGMDLTIKNRKKKNQRRNTEPSLAVKSCWSKAGIGTCFVLEETQHKKFQVVFDLGW